MSSRRLPDYLIQIIMNNYKTAPNRHAWADFDCAWKAYKELKKEANSSNGMWDISDLPDPPNIADYTDLTSERDCTIHDL